MKSFIIIILFITAGLIFPVEPVLNYIHPGKDQSIKEITVKKLQEIINNRDGKPLLINIWATWCEPCREEFPDLVKINNEYGNKLEVIGISVDFPEQADSLIVPFLEEQNAKFTIYVLNVPEPEDFINLLNKKWGGEIPATFIFDKKGVQKKFLFGKQSYEKLVNSISEVTK